MTKLPKKPNLVEAEKSNLVEVEKDGERLWVDPTTVKSHMAVGWKIVETPPVLDAVPADEEAPLADEETPPAAE